MTQLALFAVAVDERTLSDAQRTVLEVIDRAGSITVREAGRIVYRLRGWTLLLAIPKEWINSAGRYVLKQLQAAGLVRRAAKGAWVRPRCAA